MDISFRELKHSDIDTCLSIMKENYKKESERFWQDLLPKDLSDVLNKVYPSKCLTISVDKRMVGFGCYLKSPEGMYATDTYTLSWINILPQEQLKGIGKALVSELERNISKQSKGYVQILLETNKPMFYKKLGYEFLSKKGANDIMKKLIYTH